MLEGKRRRSNWVHKETNLMFTLRSGKDQRKKFTFALISRNPYKLGAQNSIRRRPRDPMIIKINLPIKKTPSIAR